MRAKLDMRAPRIAQIAAGVLLVAVPSALAATAPGGGNTNSASATYQQIHGAAATAAADKPRTTKVRFQLDHHRSSAVAGHWIKLPGRLVVVKAKRKTASAAAAPHKPDHAKVKLESHVNGRWRVVRETRTGPHGGFDFHFHVRRTHPVGLRIRFGGDRHDRATRARDGRVVGRLPLTPEVASWYYDGGNTACGFHATYGVANKTLPCGTRVSIRYGGRTVVATVDDRGPYVYGRTYDLNENTAAALGMEGVATVYASRA